MFKRFVGVVSLVSALGCTEGPARCGSCPAGSRCEPMTMLCVRDDVVDGGTAGGSAAGGSAAGGSAAGGSAAGGSAAGGSAAGGSAGGNQGGGSAAGGSAGGNQGGGVVIPPPAFMLTTPASGVAVGGATTELVGSLTFSVGREVTSATIDLGAGQTPPLTITGNIWRVTIPLPVSIEGDRTFTISALDSSGVTTTAMVTISIDTLGPRLQLTVPSATTAVGATTNLEGTATDPAMPLMAVTVDVGTGPQQATLGVAGAWQRMVSFPANLDRVMRTVTLSATDALGNVGTATAQVLVDTQGPTLAITTPASGVAVGSPTTLVGTASDPGGVVSNFTVDTGAGPTAVTVTSGAWSRMATFAANLNRVQRPIVLRGEDPLGNVTQTTVQVLVDTQGPTLTITSPASGVAVTSPTTLAGAASDPSGVVSNFTVDTGSGPAAVTVSSGTWSRMATFAANLNRVQRPIVLRGEDPLGNVTQTTVQVLVDTQGPTLIASWPPPAVRSVTAGGADFRDPTEVTGGPALWRRHDTVAVTVQSPSSDVNASGVQVALAGARVLASSGVNCSSDGGFCRVVPMPLSAPALIGLRGTFAVEAFGADTLGNASALDAGAVTVSRWAFSFDGGSPANGFSVATTGELVVPHSSRSALSVLRADGTLLTSWPTRYPSLIYAAVGQVPELSAGRFIYVFERGAGDATFGEAFPLDRAATVTPASWAADTTRTSVSALGPILRVDPPNGNEEVAVLFRQTNARPAAVWAGLVRSSGSPQFGTRFPTPTALVIGSTIQSAVATGGVITATDGTSLFSFGGSNPSNLLFMEERGVPFLQTAGSFLSVKSLVGLSANQVAGVGSLSNAGVDSFFTSTFPSSFTASSSSISALVAAPLVKAGTVFFVGTESSGQGLVCKHLLTGLGIQCLPNAAESVQNALALGEGDTLYDIAVRPPSQQAYLQARSATTLAVRWESPLPGTSGQCLGLTPTCINGTPVVGCVDLDGRIIFLATDGRGIDSAAEWPMLGHDPGTTWNQTTPLAPFTCP
ncbi:MAG: hypothetical protein Q8L14_37540 [Myxococcales bacterium]|nr:hypothetical protein [Myxococcales bacterium]